MVNPLQQLREGTSRMESGGNYNALGPVIRRRSGSDRAYGKYQVMGANIPTWTKEAIGKSLTPQEFLGDKDAQEAVFDYQMMKNLNKYGTIEDAASVWFTGRPYAEAKKAGARDINMGVEKYVRNVTGGGGEPLAYTDAPQQPFFPSLKGEAPAQMSMEDFFAGQYEAPASQKEFTQEDFFTGRYEPQGQKVVADIKSIPVEELQAKSNWGFGREAARGAVSGLTGGLGDLSKAGATVRAGYESLTGKAPEGFMPRRQKIFEELETERKAYEQENPVLSQVASSLGGGIGTLAPMGVAAKGLGAGMKAAEVAAPKLAPAIQGVGKFFTGQNATLGGIPSAIAEGALYGGGEAALTQQLVPEEDRGLKSLVFGAVGGGAASGLFSPLARSLGKSFTSSVPPDRVKMINMAKDKFDLDLHLGQVSENPEVSRLYKEIVPPKKQMQQVDKWNTKLSEAVGLEGKPLTDANIQAGKREWGEKIAESVKNKKVVVEEKFYQDLLNHAQELNERLPAQDPLRGAFQNFVHEIAGAIGPGGQIDGKVLHGFLRHQGRIDRVLGNMNDPLAKSVAHDMRDLLLDAFEKSEPAAAKALKEARGNYKKLSAIDELVAGSNMGKVSPDKLKGAVKARKIVDPTMNDLANIGEFLPGLSNDGALRVANKPFSWRSAGELAAAFAAPAANMAGIDLGYGQLVSYGLLADLARRYGQGRVMGSNALNRFAQQPYFQPAARASGNILYGTAGAFGAGAGSMEREQ